MADHLFDGDYDPPSTTPGVPVSTGDHLFDGDFAAVTPKTAPSWMDKTITGAILKSAGKFATLPGEVAQGKFDTQPTKPGEWSDVDEARRLINEGNLKDRSTEAAGFVGGGAVPGVVRAGESALLPFLNGGVGKETAQIAKTAIDKYNYPVRPGQMSDNWFVRSLDTMLQKLPFSGYKGNVLEQQGAINKGVAKLIGVDADKVNPAVMSEARDNLKKNYKEIYSPDVKAKLDDQFSAGVLNTLERAEATLDSPDKVKVLSKAVGNILDKVKGDGEISGPAYQGLRQEKSTLKDLIKGGGPVGQYAGEIRSHLDDLFRRTVPPDKANLLRQTDQQYAIMKSLRPIVDEGGDISAQSLMRIARAGDAGKERMAFGKGGDLGELATIGQRFKSMPSSNTAENSTILNLLLGGGAGITGLGALTSNPLAMVGPAATAAVSGATTRLLGQYMKSPKRAEKLISRALDGGSSNQGNKLLDAGVKPYLPVLEGSLPNQ
jgi:hypothetical protein